MASRGTRLRLKQAKSCAGRDWKNTRPGRRGADKEKREGRPKRDRGGVEMEGGVAPSLVAGVDNCMARREVWRAMMDGLAHWLTCPQSRRKAVRLLLYAADSCGRRRGDG
ncbi:hypothetical protein TOPH_01742 [Tolypocladium ophioglossoides CBS 100239]|uniref:Uncharacterized protein n=1 Tax=Tolypocladium ophioglossoides (strain CBS 100239) TaxID=1163406 RepID=A0A0L0NHK6_TOLOC|nr:hypothetical protein TOPH_01742 [Tolypocladium ophioglossoides CBS 100239]